MSFIHVPLAKLELLDRWEPPQFNAAHKRAMGSGLPLRDIILVLGVVTIWGVSFSVVKVGLCELPPIFFIASRFLIVAVPAVFFVPFPKTSIWSVLAVGLLIGVIKFGLLFIAMNTDANAGVASLVLQAQIFFTIALSYLVLGETITRRQVAGIALAVLGFLFFFGSAGDNITVLGLFLIGIAAFAWALANLVMKRMPQVNLLHFMIWVSLVPVAPLIVVSFMTETTQPLSLLFDISFKAWLAIGYMGYMSTLVAYAWWGKLLSRHSASLVTPFALLIPVVGLTSSALWLGESLSIWEASGAGLIMLGLLVSVLSSNTTTSEREGERS